ncbi:MAG TPA: fatty acid desaturase [Amycolatopsis sp.]|uniref:fatty acid desaturase n=1 Tax=Amycolatopsis sp. TaxID=37632 RepID=UPI002B497FC6|nr:fatty acid desaturase [Amycolatopsis sp.]HKS47185.1 fatty acid desaturase [Amycolatopsis sp.]
MLKRATAVDEQDFWDPFLEVGHSAPETAQGREERAFVERSRNLTTEVRESVSRAIRRMFPRPVAVLLEAAVTWVSGCPHRGQQELVKRGKVAYTLEAFGGFAVAVVLAHLAVVTELWFVLPVLWLVLAGRTWALFNIFHHATHNTLFRSKRLNRVLAFWISIISFSSSLDSYRKEHIRSHHTRAMCTYEDKEAVFMSLGFSPGMPKSYYYRRLAWLILSPRTYLLYTRYRLWDWQKQEPWPRRIAVWAYAAALVAVAYRLDLMESLLLSYVVPLFVVFNITGLLGTFSEHHWGTLLDKPARVRLVLLQQSRFLLDSAPDRTLPLRRRMTGWARWWGRLLFYHLPVRVAVLPGDSVHHDHHHRHPRTETWTSSTYERFDHVCNGCPGFENFPHTHAWSLGEAIDRVFTRMSAAPRPDNAEPFPDFTPAIVRRLKFWRRSPR